MGERQINAIANIIAQLEALKTAIDRPLAALNDFAEIGSITPASSTDSE